MKSAFVCLIFLAVLIECYGRRRCSYRRYSSSGRYTTTYYSCASNKYCCGTQSCCTYVYTRWYIWTVVVITFVIAFILWWYYRYRYRRARQVVVAQVPHTQAVHTTVAGNVMRVPAAYPVYSPPGQATVIPGGANFQHPAYPPQVYAYQDPPPPYTSTTVVKQGAFVSTST